jgi:solute:Na+ symporter, SSS family
MNAMGIGLIAFVALFLFLGLGSFWLVKGSGKRYIVCGKTLPLAFIATMLTAQAIDANSTIGNSSLVFSGGFWAGFSIPLGLAACLLITGLFFAKPLNRMNLLTLPDFYFRRYGSGAELLTSILMGISFIILVAGNFAGCAWIVAVTFNLPYLDSLIIVSILILLYSVAGGLFSSALTNFVQIYPAIVGFVAGAIWLIKTRGWHYLMQAVPPGFLDLSGVISPRDGAFVNWGQFMALALGDVVALDFMERVFAARTPRTARLGCYIGAALTLITGLSCSLMGILSIRLMPDLADSRMVLPTLALKIFPFVYGLLLISGVIGAGASTANGGILGVSIVLGRNILQRNVQRWKDERRPIKGNRNPSSSGNNIFMSDKRLLFVSRIMALPVVFLAVVLAWVRPEPGILLALAFDVVFAGCFVPLAGGIYWKKSNAAGALASIVSGSLLRAVLYIAIPQHLKGLDTLIPPVISLLVFVIVCLLTQERFPSRHHVIQEIPSDADVIAGVV